MFSRVLIANRGEIAVRIARTLRAMGIASVAVYSDADAGAPHVAVADEARRIGPATPADSYLHVQRVVEAAVEARVDALHPGYGFLSENPLLAAACADAGIVFVGPPAEAIAAMGDKIRARTLVAAAGVPVVPGRADPDMRDDDVERAAREIGLPVMLKPAAGGGGKGMRVVHDASSLRAEIEASRREAAAAFGDDRLLVERFVERPRHIEIQIAADVHGGVVHFGERECTLQRRHQKIIEEAPSPFVTTELRDALAAHAIAVARSCAYTNIGTVEFVVSNDAPDELFFLEMNTRLQVEHPVTELVYGLDLVELQLRLAARERLPWDQSAIVPAGHAVEARVYAEDPHQGFLPTGGRVRVLHEPRSQGVRVDSGLAEGYVVTSHYDPMLAKVVAHGRDREEAFNRLDRALAATVVAGATTNVAYLRGLASHDLVRAGDLDTRLVDRLGALGEPPDASDDVLVAACLARLGDDAAGEDLWSAPSGWRVAGSAWLRFELDAPGRGAVEVRLRRRDAGWLARVGDRDVGDVTSEIDGRRLLVRSRSGLTAYHVAHTGATTWLAASGSAWELHFERRDAATPGSVADRGRVTTKSPMPGTVTSVLVEPGARTIAGQPLVIVEAMKMEHTIASPLDGVVDAVHVSIHDRVERHAPLVSVVSADGSGDR